jgi:type I restriction enzyme S subunit
VSGWPHIRLKWVVGLNERKLPATIPDSLLFRYIDISTCGRGVLIAEPEQMEFGAAPSRARRLVRAGDTIASTVRTYLRAVWPVTGSADDLVVSTGFAVLTPTDGLDARYLGWLIQSDLVIEEIVARSVGVSFQRSMALRSVRSRSPFQTSPISPRSPTTSTRRPVGSIAAWSSRAGSDS